MADVTVSHLNDRLVAIKQSPDDPDALHREARVLSRLDHPGVVGFVEFDDREPPALWMRHAGTESWDHDAPKEATAVIAGLASVAATVRDLHDLGIAHGNLQPAHVIVSRDGRPILCSFAHASDLTAASAAVDGEGLARLIEHLAHPLDGDLRRRLDTLAHEVGAGSVDPAELTRRLDELGHRRTGRRIRPPQLRTAAAVVAATVAAVTIAMIATGSADQPDTQADATAPPSPAPSPTTTSLPPRETNPSTPPTTSAPPEPTLPAPPVAPSAPSAPGIEFVHEGRRVAVGQQGDIAVLGDWDCDGIDTPALLEVAIGRVSVFAAWPDALATVAPSHTTTIREATDLSVEASDACDRLRVIHSAGSTLMPMEGS